MIYSLFTHVVGYGLIAYWAALPGEPVVLVFSLALAGGLIWASVVDLDCYEIPDIASLGLCATGVVSCAALAPFGLVDHLAAGIVCGFLFWTISEVHFRLRGYEGLGLGDAKLYASAGFWLGSLGAIWVLFLSATLGALAGLVAKHGKEHKRGIAYGPFLSISIWLIWLYGVPL